MALTGNIEIFPLPEILRLLARAGKNGCLRVDTGDLDGRIYLEDGALSLATVGSDSELLDQFTASGVVDLDRLASRDVVDLPAGLAAGRSADDLSAAVREHSIEALYRIRRPGRGSFEFVVDAVSRFRTGQSFDIESLVSDADRRAADWADIERTLDDLDLAVRMVRELQVPETTVNAPTWRVLAALEGGSTVRDVARQLGTTEFLAAREIAHLIRSDLVEPVPTVLGAPDHPVGRSLEDTGSREPHEPTPTVPASEPGPAPSPWAIADSEPREAEPADPWHAPPPENGRLASEVESTWSAETDTATEEPSRPDRSAGWWAEAMGNVSDDPDTDEFLEGVFAEEIAEAEPEETGFSVGLLRRRRLGPAARDITDAD
ncbi:MAG: DUF4388 domain-containing protein [Acidimicrobiia bacterium]